MGSTGVLQVALGRTAADEYGANLSELSRRIVGNVGLFFTKLPREEVGLTSCFEPALRLKARGVASLAGPQQCGCAGRENLRGV